MINMEYELCKVLSKYPIGEFGEIEPLNLGTANKSFLINAGNQKYVIRSRNKKYSSDIWINFEIEYLKHLWHKKISVPFPIMNIDGLYYTRTEESVFQVLPYIEGGNFDCNSLADIAEGGAFLGKLHTVVSDFHPLQPKDLPRYDCPTKILKAIDHTIETHKENINNEEKKALNFIRDQVIQILDFMPDDEYHNLPKLVIHGDYHPANVKYSNGKICGLFDFDWISEQPRLRDIIDGLIYFSSIRSENIASGDILSLVRGYTLDIPRSKVFLKRYIENISKPLTKNEFKYMLCLIKSRLMHSRVQALAKIPKERAVEMLTTGIIEPLRWLDENQNLFINSLMSL